MAGLPPYNTKYSHSESSMKTCQALKIIAVASAFAVSTASLAKPAIFSWNDETCTYTGQYDTSKVSATQLKNTAHLLQSRAPMFDKQDSAAKNAGVLAAFLVLTQDNTRYIQHPAIDVLRQRQQAQAQFWHDLTAIEQRVSESHDYAVLAQFHPEKTQACLPIVQALSRLDDQTALIKEVFTKDCSDNADPARCVASQMKSPKSALLNYSWHNCANNAQPEIGNTQLRNANTVFLAQFKNIKRKDCEEP